MRYARKTPCAECPFRRKSWAGYLGDNQAEAFIDPVVGQRPTECHMDVDYEDRAWRDKLDQTKACAGAAQFLANSHSHPRDPAYAAYVASLGPNEEVFTWRHEFLAHHDNDTNRRFVAMADERRPEEATPPPEIPEPNAVECLDCGGTIYRGVGTECPEDPEDHVVEPVYVAAAPLGRPDDDDQYHHGMKLWVYNIEQ